MPLPSTASIYRSHNDVIQHHEGGVEGESYFWSLCRPRVELKKQTCLRCGRVFNTRDLRCCTQCDPEKIKRSNAKYKAKIRNNSLL